MVERGGIRIRAHTAATDTGRYHPSSRRLDNGGIRFTWRRCDALVERVPKVSHSWGLLRSPWLSSAERLRSSKPQTALSVCRSQLRPLRTLGGQWCFGLIPGSFGGDLLALVQKFPNQARNQQFHSRSESLLQTGRGLKGHPHTSGSESKQLWSSQSSGGQRGSQP